MLTSCTMPHMEALLRKHSTHVWCNFQAFLFLFTLTDTVLVFVQVGSAGKAGKASKAISCAGTSLTSLLPVITLDSPQLLLRLSL